MHSRRQTKEMCIVRLICVICIEITLKWYPRDANMMCSASVQNMMWMESSILDSKHMAK